MPVASKLGVTLSALIESEVTAKAARITDQEVEAFYEANKARLRGEEAAIRGRIRSHLQDKKLQLSGRRSSDRFGRRRR